MRTSAPVKSTTFQFATREPKTTTPCRGVADQYHQTWSIFITFFQSNEDVEKRRTISFDNHYLYHDQRNRIAINSKRIPLGQ